jgi:hypothetical protein
MVVFASYATDERGKVAAIAPGGKTKIGVKVPGASAGNFKSLSLRLDAPDVLTPVVAAVDGWRNNPFFTPKSKAEIEEDRLEKEAKVRVSLHVQAMLGGIWLVNPQDKEILDGASVGENFTAGFIFSATNRLNNLSGGGIRGSIEAGARFAGTARDCAWLHRRLRL